MKPRFWAAERLYTASRKDRRVQSCLEQPTLTVNFRRQFEVLPTLVELLASALGDRKLLGHSKPWNLRGSSRAKDWEDVTPGTKKTMSVA